MPRPKMKRTGGPSIEDELPIWEFIYENVAVNEVYDEVSDPLLEAYVTTTESKFSVEQLKDFYEKVMEPGLYKTELDDEKILALYKALEIEISPHAEQMLERRCGAGLRLDADRILIHYTFFTAPKTKKKKMVVEQEDNVKTSTPVKEKEKAPERKDEKSPSVKRPPVREATPPEEDHMPRDVTVDAEFEGHMWQHIIDNFPSLTAKRILAVEFWQELLDDVPMPIKSPYIVLRYFQSHLLKKLWRLRQGVDVNVKLQLLKNLIVPLTPMNQQWLLDRQQVEVTLTADGYIDSWRNQQPDPPLPQRNIATWTPRFDPPRPPVGPSVNEVENGYPSRGGSIVRSKTNSRAESSLRSSQMRVPKTEEEEEGDMTASSVFRRTGRIPFTKEEDLQAWKFILKKMYDPLTKQLVVDGVQPKGNRFWDEYIRVYNSPKSNTNWSSHFRKKMCATLHEMNLARDTKLLLYLHLQVPISDEVHRFLERECAAKMRISTDGRLISWRFRSGAARERTIDTEPLVNDDEETDGESVTAAVPNVNDVEEGRGQNGGDDSRNVPSTSSSAGINVRKRRKSEEEKEDEEVRKEKQKEKKRMLEEEERTPVTKPIDEKQNETFSTPKSRSYKRPVKIPVPKKSPMAPPAKPQELSHAPPQSPPQTPPQLEEVENNSGFVIEESPILSPVKPVQNGKTTEKVVVIEEEEEEEELDEQYEVEEPFDLDKMNGGFMSKNDLLMAIQRGLENEGDEAHGAIHDAVSMAFRKTEHQDATANEQVARLRITETIANHAHPLHQDMLSGYQLDLIDKTTECCENPDVFRERLAQVATNLSGRLQKMQMNRTPSNRE